MEDASRVLAIDDDVALLRFLEHLLKSLSVEIVTEADPATGIQTYQDGQFDLVFVDYMMPDMNGVDVLRQIREADPNANVIIMTGNASVESAIEAMKLGAVDYLTKPLDPDHLEIILRKNLQHKYQAEKLRLLEDQVVRQGSYEGLVGVSREMQALYRLIDRVADSNVTVLIQGETGTGKELVAKAIHRRSRRANKQFLPINCGALAENVLESELFGHEKGAFTGADRSKKGLIEQVDGGTLFLDEIEEMSPALQVKLLRVIQELEVLPVGGRQPVKVDFRLIAASNENLRDMMDRGEFRSDLFYRLSVANLELPALRTRRSDIPLLAKHFLNMYGPSENRLVGDISEEALMLLQAYKWPGNVRELENVIQQAVLLCDTDKIEVNDLPPQFLVEDSISDVQSAWFDLPLKDAMEKFEQRYLEEMLNRANGRVSEAAKLSDVNRRSFYAKMNRYNISRE